MKPRTALRSTNPAAVSTSHVVQSGVVAYRVRADGLLQILLVTNSVGEWIVPKGHVKAGLSPSESARKEAFEEAGVLGEIDGTGHGEIGRYAYDKSGKEYVVALFAMRVTRVMNSWQEMHKRERVWVSIDEAMRRVELSGLRDVLDRFNQAADRMAA